MADRGTDSGDEEPTGLTQEWVPIALRGPTAQPEEDRTGAEEEGGADAEEEEEEIAIEDSAISKEVNEGGPAPEATREGVGDSSTARDSGFGPIPGDDESELVRRRVDEAAREALEQSAGIVAGEARSRFEAEIERIEQEARARIDALVEHYDGDDDRRRGRSEDAVEGDAADEDDRPASAALLERLTTIEERLESVTGGLHDSPESSEGLVEQQRLMSDRMAAIERAADGSGDEARQVQETLTQRLESQEAKLAAFEDEHRRETEALVESLGSRSAEASRRMMAIEQRTGELALEVEASSERTAEQQRDLGTETERSVAQTEARIEEVGELARRSQEQASEASGRRIDELVDQVGSLGDGLAKRISELEADLRAATKISEGRMEALDRRATEVSSERTERLAGLERTLDDLGQMLNRTRTAAAEREKTRHESLQRTIDEIATSLNQKLERSSDELSGRVAEIAAKVEALAQPEPMAAMPAPREERIPLGRVGVGRDPLPGTAPTHADEVLDLNQVSFEQLRGLGLSVTQSSRLLDYRTSRGRLLSVDELDALPGFPDAVRAEVKRRLAVEE